MPDTSKSTLKVTKAEKIPFVVLGVAGAAVDTDLDAISRGCSELISSAAKNVIFNFQELKSLTPGVLDLFKRCRAKLAADGKNVRIANTANDVLPVLLAGQVAPPQEFVASLPDAIKAFNDAAGIASRPVENGMRLLIADADVLMLRGLARDPWAMRLPPVICDTGARAIQALDDEKLEVGALFIGVNVVMPDVISVIRRAHQLRPGVPITLVLEADGINPHDEDQLRKLGVRGTITKPISYTELVKEFLPPRELFDVTEIMRQSAKDDSPVGSELDVGGADFVPINARRFLSGSKCLFDVHVRLGDAKFLKITRAGDEFSQDRLQSYINKGITYFYIRKEMQEQYIAFCDRVMQAVSKSPKATPETRFFFAVDQGQAILNFLVDKGTLRKDRFAFAASYMKSLWGILKDMKDLDQSAVVQSFIKESPGFAHSVSVAMFASLIAREMGMETERSLKIVGLASLFHDLGLQGLPEHLNTENEEEMNEGELSVYHKHPVRGAEILAEIRGLDPVVSQAVAQHHWRRDGSGFPNRSGIAMSQISTPAEIVGMCDAYQRAIGKYGKDFNGPHRDEMSKMVLRGFSPELADAFISVFQVK